MPRLLEHGDKAPDFQLAGSDGKSLRLSDLNGKKVVLYFFPAAFTPGCTKESCDFQDNLSNFTSHGFHVVGISKDSVEKLKKFADGENLHFQLLSDSDLSTHKLYGAFGEKSMYGKKVTGVIRSTFVIDEEGKIEHALYNVKAAGHVDLLMRKLNV